jgi:lysophospholipase L1-like esterase
MNRLGIFSLVLLSTCAARAEFALRDGDTVVFLGDSITAARQYTKVIETYTLLRFPERRVRFVNAGKGGETAKGSLARLDEAVFAEGATVVTVAYGVNDMGWGMKADAAHRQEYLDAIAELVKRCRARGVRVFLCSAAITAEDPEKAERGFLQRMCDDGLARAKAGGAETIDVQRSMRAVQRRVLASNARPGSKEKPASLHVADGVHLNELGQMAMAFAILKGLGAPAEVSAASIDAKRLSVDAVERCLITNVVRQTNALSFTRVDERWPLNLQPLWMLHGLFIPLSDELNRYMLTIKNLVPGRYEVLAGGRALGTWSADALARGVNIASATADPWVPGGPWDAQAHAVKVLVDMRDDLVFMRRALTNQLPVHPHLNPIRERTTAMEQDIVRLQRDLARPIPVPFEIKPHAGGGN